MVMNSLLFRAAFEKKVKHVIFFSCTVMLQSNNKPQTEIDYDANIELHPRYFGVGQTKLYLEKMCDFYSRIGETKYTVIRHTNIYGPHDNFILTARPPEAAPHIHMWLKMEGYKIPLKKIGSPEDIANIAIFLSSDEASYVTGQTFHVNGGMLMV